MKNCDKTISLIFFQMVVKMNWFKLCLILMLAVCIVGMCKILNIFLKESELIQFKNCHFSNVIHKYFRNQMIKAMFFFIKSFILLINLTAKWRDPGCGTGNIESIRFSSEVEPALDEYDSEKILSVTAIKIDSVFGECYTENLIFRYILLRAYSAQGSGIQIKVHSDNCYSGSSHYFDNFTLYRHF